MFAMLDEIKFQPELIDLFLLSREVNDQCLTRAIVCENHELYTSLIKLPSQLKVIFEMLQIEILSNLDSIKSKNENETRNH